MSGTAAVVVLSPAGQVAERLRAELKRWGIAADVNEGEGLALVSVWVDLVIWCEPETNGWRYRWWTGRVSAQTGRRVYTGCRAEAVTTAAHRVAERFTELRHSHPLSPFVTEFCVVYSIPYRLDRGELISSSHMEAAKNDRTEEDPAGRGGVGGVVGRVPTAHGGGLRPRFDR
ncbi:hypothetical protein ACFHYQ_15410 [Sphaerimonospora cavernae]|uniref:Uncharacterized protein n=1 Tax=Sphaerimonospora cavernae TaxID=1740611 RepID=A0ABV6U5E5_9ACTN